MATPAYDFISSATTECIMMKLDRNQVFNILYECCWFFGQSVNKESGPGLWMWFFSKPGRMSRELMS